MLKAQWQRNSKNCCALVQKSSPGHQWGGVGRYFRLLPPTPEWGHLYPREVNITARGEMDVLTETHVTTLLRSTTFTFLNCLEAVMQPTHRYGFLIYSFHNLQMLLLLHRSCWGLRCPSQQTGAKWEYLLEKASDFWTKGRLKHSSEKNVLISWAPCPSRFLSCPRVGPCLWYTWLVGLLLIKFWKSFVIPRLML